MRKSKLELDKEVKEEIKDEIKPEDTFVKKEEFNAMNKVLGDVLSKLTIMSGRFSDKKIHEIVQGSINQGQPVTLGEIGDKSIEQVTGTDHMPVDLELTAFMEELIVIQVNDVINEWDCEIFPISVNGQHQPILRGVPQRLKRKYVEVMARCRETEYRQKKPKPDREILLNLTPLTKPKYPFMILEDPNKRGVQWINALKNEAH